MSEPSDRDPPATSGLNGWRNLDHQKSFHMDTYIAAALHLKPVSYTERHIVYSDSHMYKETDYKAFHRFHTRYT